MICPRLKISFSYMLGRDCRTDLMKDNTTGNSVNQLPLEFPHILPDVQIPNPICFHLRQQYNLIVMSSLTYKHN